MGLPPFLEQNMVFPMFHHVRLAPSRPPSMDPVDAVVETVDGAVGRMAFETGQTVAVAIGSRGISNLPPIVRAACDALKRAGLVPFIVPAMGSHGGATGEGQRAVLHALGVVPSAVGVADYRVSMSVERIGTAFGSVPVFYSSDALSADHAICINRIKPHTKFKGPVESGLLKMICVGLGKHEGAIAYHQWALRYGFSELLMEMGRVALMNSNFRFGLALVEDDRDRTVVAEAVSAPRILDREPELLGLAKRLFPALPVHRLDVLVVGRIGKEISGAGMDPNVTGRAWDMGESDFSDVLKARRLAVLSLTEATDGNALGVGNADIISERVFRAMDYEKTAMNGLTSLSLRKVFIPIRMPDDRKAIQACFATLGPIDPAAVRALLIRDTRHVSEFLASGALIEDLKDLPGIHIADPADLVFDRDNGLVLPF